LGALSWAHCLGRAVLGGRVATRGGAMLQTKGWRQRGDALPRLMDGRTDETDGELLDAGATVATTERAADPN